MKTALEWMKTRGVRRVGAAGGAFWPGVPENLPGALRFFRKHGWKTGERYADLTGDVSKFRAPRWVMERAREAGSVMGVAKPSDGPAIVAFEKRNFPEWYRGFRNMVRAGRYDDILMARDAAGRIQGTLMFSRRDRYIPWESVLGRVGGFGCVGVAPRARGRGIGLAMCARAMELLREMGGRRIFVAWVYLIKWYGQLGLRPWRTYRAVRRRLP